MGDAYWAGGTGGNTTNPATAGNWKAANGDPFGSEPDSDDTIHFDGAATHDCVFTSLTKTYQNIKIHDSFGKTLTLNGSTLTVTNQMTIYTTYKISSSTASTINFTGNISNGPNVIYDSSAAVAEDFGIFTNQTSRQNLTFHFERSGSMVMTEGVYPNVTLTCNLSPTTYASVTNNYGEVKILNFTLNATFSVQPYSASAVSSSDLTKIHRIEGTLSLNGTNFKWGKSILKLAPGSATATFPSNGNVASFGAGTPKVFNAEYYDLRILPNKSYYFNLTSSAILSCHRFEVEDGGRIYGPTSGGSAEIHSTKLPIVRGDWNFRKISESVYRSATLEPLLGVPHGGTGLSAIGEGGEVLAVHSSGNYLEWSSTAGGGTSRTVTVDTDGDGSANETLGASETLMLKKGSNITLAESGGVVTISSTDTDTNTNQLTTFTLRGTTNTTPTTVNHGDTITIAAGTGITTTSTSDGTITIANTVTDTNTQLSQEQVEDFVNGVMVGGTNLTKTYDDAAGTLTLNVDDAFLKNNANDTTSGTITAAGFTTTNGPVSFKRDNDSAVTMVVEQDGDGDIATFKGASDELITIRRPGSIKWNLSTAGGAANESIMTYRDTAGDERNFISIDAGTIVIHNRGPDGDVEIRGNSSTAGGGGETTIAKFEDTTINLYKDVIVGGNLTVSGTTTTVNTATLTVEDPLIALASGNNAADTVDIGFYGLYDTSGSQDLYAGLFRDANDSGKFKLFKDLQAAPGTTVDTTGTGYAVASLVANLEGNVTGNVSGTAATVTGAAQSNITSLGTLTTLTVDNVIINGTTIGHTSDTDLITLASNNVTFASKVTIGDSYMQDDGSNWQLYANSQFQFFSLGQYGAHTFYTKDGVNGGGNVKQFKVDYRGFVELANNRDKSIFVEATAEDTAGKDLTLSAGHTTAGTTDNIAGGDLIFEGGQGKGTGAGGEVIFKVANAGSSGSSLNALTETMRLTTTGSIELSNGTPATPAADHVRMTEDGGYLKVNTPSGYISIGPGSTSWGHILTDRAKFYFNKPLVVAGGNTSGNAYTLSSYSTADLVLATQNGAENRITIKSDDGAVGIGITDPEELLHLSGAAAGGSVSFKVTNTDDTDDASVASIHLENERGTPSNFYLEHGAYGETKFYTGQGAKNHALTLNADGTTTVEAALTGDSTASFVGSLTMNYAGSDVFADIIGPSNRNLRFVLRDNGDTDAFIFRNAAGTDIMKLLRTGTLLVGKSAPTTTVTRKFETEGTMAAASADGTGTGFNMKNSEGEFLIYTDGGDMLVKDYAGSATYPFKIVGAAETDTLKIMTGGDVRVKDRLGVGTDTPSTKLEVVGDITAERLNLDKSSGFSSIEVKGGDGAFIDLGNKDGTHDDFDARLITDGTGLDIIVTAASNHITLKTNNSQRFKVEDSAITMYPSVLQFSSGSAPTIKGGAHNPLTIYGNTDGTAQSTTNNIVSRSTAAAIDFDVNASQQLAMSVRDNKDVYHYGVLSGPGIAKGGYGANSFNFGATGDTTGDGSANAAQDWYEVFRWTPNATMSATTSNQYRNFAAKFNVIGRGLQRINYDIYVRGEYGVQGSTGWWAREFIIDGLDITQADANADGNADTDSPDADTIFKMVYNAGTSLSMPYASLYMKRDEHWEIRTCNLISMFTNCVFEFKDTNIGETDPTNDTHTGSYDLSPSIRKKLRLDTNNNLISGVTSTGIKFSDDGHITLAQDKKIYFDSTDTYIYADTSTDEKLRIGADGDILLEPDGSVGLGTNSPENLLHVNGTIQSGMQSGLYTTLTSNQLIFHRTSASYIDQDGDGGSINFRVETESGGSSDFHTELTVKEDNIIIPNKLSVGTTANGTGALTVTSSGHDMIHLNRLVDNEGYGMGIIGRAGNDTSTSAAHEYAGLFFQIEDHTDGAEAGGIAFHVSSGGVAADQGSTHAMQIKSNGYVGIGTSSPTLYSTGGKGLHINDATYPELRLTNDTTGTASGNGALLQVAGSDFYIWQAESAHMYFATSADVHMKLDSGGNLGIGGVFVSQNVNGMLHVRDENDGSDQWSGIRVFPADNETSATDTDFYHNITGFRKGGLMLSGGQDGNYTRTYATLNNDGFKVFTNAGDNTAVNMSTQQRLLIPTGGGAATLSVGLNITGALTATTKSFDIEHPTKEGMRLHHGSLEGPEHGVYTRGKNNSGTIHLPDYWKGLVDEDTITVQLTAIGKPQDLYVREIKNGRIRVAAKSRGTHLNYFYFIQAERKDVEKMVVEY